MQGACQLCTQYLMTLCTKQSDPQHALLTAYLPERFAIEKIAFEAHEIWSFAIFLQIFAALGLGNTGETVIWFQHLAYQIQTDKRPVHHDDHVLKLLKGRTQAYLHRI